MSLYKAKLEKRYLSDIASFSQRALLAYGCRDPQITFDLLHAIDEACTNIMTHGRKSQRKDYLMIEIERVGNAIAVIITDFGDPFPFDAIKPISHHASLDEKLAHGFGVGFIKQLTDEHRYQSFSEHNELYLRRNLS